MRNLILALSITTMAADPALAQDDYGRPNAFDQGSISASAALGFSSSYYIFGGGVGFFVWDGLEVSFDVQHWFGKGTFIDITKISPGIRYVFYQVPTFHPYVGVFYRHLFLHTDLYDDADTIGARLGAIYAPGRLFIGLGARYEYVVKGCGCAFARSGESIWSPEVSIGITF